MDYRYVVFVVIYLIRFILPMFVDSVVLLSIDHVTDKIQRPSMSMYEDCMYFYLSSSLNFMYALTNVRYHSTSIPTVGRTFPVKEMV